MGDAKFLPYADGAKIEHFDQFASSSKEDIVMYWRMATKAAEEGKIVLYKAWPDHEANFTNPEFMKQNAAELEAIARNKITFPLACYLIGGSTAFLFLLWVGIQRRRWSACRLSGIPPPTGASKGSREPRW